MGRTGVDDMTSELQVGIPVQGRGEGTRHRVPSRGARNHRRTQAWRSIITKGVDHRSQLSMSTSYHPERPRAIGFSLLTRARGVLHTTRQTLSRRVMSSKEESESRRRETSSKFMRA